MAKANWFRGSALLVLGAILGGLWWSFRFGLGAPRRGSATEQSASRSSDDGGRGPPERYYTAIFSSDG